MASNTGFVERVHDFVAENKKAVLIGTAAAAIAVGGAVYYASTSRPADGTDLEKGDKKDRKKSSKGTKKKKSVKDKDGPILEERKPKVQEEAGGEHRIHLNIARRNILQTMPR